MTNPDPERSRICFAVYTQVDESEIKTTPFGHVSGDSVNPEFKVGTSRLSNPDIFSVLDLLSLQ